MKKIKNKRILISTIILGILIILLITILMLKFTGYLELNNDIETPRDEIQENENNYEELKNAIYYQYYSETPSDDRITWKSWEISLYEDNTVEYRYGGTSIDDANYEGTISKKGNQIVLKLSLIMEDDEMCNNETSDKECQKTITLVENENGTLTQVEDLGNGETTSYIYQKVTALDLKLPIPPDNL